MASRINFNYRDFSDEYSDVGLYIPDVDETTWLATDTAVLALQAALAAITIGSLAQKTLVAYSDKVDDTRPADANAQREIGLRFHFTDDVNFKKGYFTVPCPDLNIVAEGGTDQVDLEEVLVAAVVTAIEGFAKTVDGNDFTIDRAVIVGRRN